MTIFEEQRKKISIPLNIALGLLSFPPTHIVMNELSHNLCIVLHGFSVACKGDAFLCHQSIETTYRVYLFKNSRF